MHGLHWCTFWRWKIPPQRNDLKLEWLIPTAGYWSVGTLNPIWSKVFPSVHCFPSVSVASFRFALEQEVVGHIPLKVSHSFGWMLESPLQMNRCRRNVWREFLSNPTLLDSCCWWSNRMAILGCLRQTDTDAEDFRRLSTSKNILLENRN